MNKDIKGMMKDTFVLFAITLIAGLILGVVYQVTKEPIECRHKKRNRKLVWKYLLMRLLFELLEVTAVTEDGYYTPQDEQWVQMGFEGVDIEVMSALDSNGSIGLCYYRQRP